VVDRFAMQTLRHTMCDGQLQVAERADQLAQGAEIDPQALFDYLYFHAIPSPKTVFKGVRRLPPGHVIWQDATGVHQQRYWAPTMRHALLAALDAGEAPALAPLVREALQQARAGWARAAE
jgi:asparagine synthase (glutamine-hydrolysing)